MSDDIVTRLRAIGKLTCYRCQEFVCEVNDEECCKHHDWHSDCCHDRNEIVSSAAVEIERLRNEVKVRDLQILANFRSMDAMHKELYGDAD